MPDGDPLAPLRRPGVLLTLGYNTAVFGLLLRLGGRRHAMNMDGIEWQRAKWSWPFRLWFRANERIADHPAIADHLARHVRRERIAVIPYGAERIETADPAPLAALGLVPGGYCLVIARPQPENSIREIVAAFSARPRGLRLEQYPTGWNHPVGRFAFLNKELERRPAAYQVGFRSRCRCYGGCPSRAPRCWVLASQPQPTNSAPDGQPP